MAKQKDLVIPDQKSLSVTELIQRSSKELARALPEHMKAERIVRIALTAVRLNPELAKCTPESFLGSLFVLAQMGLEPIAGRSYLLPFNNKKKIGNDWKSVKEVQAIIGYKGLVELFYRHELALSIDMQTVYENDDFDFAYGTESFLRHKPALKDRGKTIGFYAAAKMKGGANIFKFMSEEDCLKHGQKHSKSWDNKKKIFNAYSPWAKEPNSMCMKTVLIQLAKLLPLSVEIQRFIEADETSRNYREGIDDALSLPPTTDWTPEEPVSGSTTPVDSELVERLCPDTTIKCWHSSMNECEKRQGCPAYD